MQKKLTILTVGLMMGWQLASAPLAQSVAGSGLILALMGAAAAVPGIVIIADDDDLPDDGSGTPPNGNEGVCESK
ncbi:MAG: hypothetical protein BGO76_05335 [Caedibacter sp. 38-128]|nr:hypothetical protein [Holosporales bacterium]OJX03473.1 MAG: hypothetical protein BGO76_05335 [Caedibacter sp. 38-128]